MTKDITTNGKLQELDSIQGEKEKQQTSPVPLILKQTSTGLVAHGENRVILQQFLWTRAVKMLKDQGICLRNGVLFDWRKRRYLDSLPKSAYDKCLEKHDYIIANKIVGKKQAYEYTPVRNGSLVSVSHYLPAPQLKRKIEESLCLPEVVFENELTGDDEDGIYTPAVSARVDEETREYAKGLFGYWLRWMQANAPDQLNFFKQIARGFLFSNRFDVEHEAKINFGVGPNRAGKGTLITFLECIPNLGDFAVWQPTDCASEYRHASIFKERVTLSVCHEWRDLPRQDNFIALIKQAVRREALTVRDVGTKTRQIVCPSEFVIFFNSSHGDNKSRALGESHEMLAKWDAYDRINAVFIDWSRRFDRFPEIDRILRRKAGRDAWGLAVYDWAMETLKDEIPEVYPIPTSVADSRSEANLSKWERALIGIVEVLVEVRDLVSERRGSLVSLAEYREEANLLARRRMRQILKRESADSFVLSERNDEVFWGVNAKWLTAALKQFGAPTQWKVPANLANVLDKAISEQVKIKGSGWTVVFDLDEASQMGL